VTAPAAAGFVLDNSVAMRWCFAPAVHPYADAILRRLAAGERAAAPVLWLYEAAAVLVRAQQKGALGGTEAGAFLAVLRDLRVIIDRDSEVFDDVRNVAIVYRLTAYDAAYLELAIRLQRPLATLDDELVRASAAAGVAIFAP
jgi:predicted nucleic acid-binding protein